MSSVSPSLSLAMLKALPELGVELSTNLKEQLGRYDGSARLPMDVQDAIWLELEHQALPGAGLLLGGRFQPDHYDMPGFLLMSCASIEDAANRLIRYSPLIGQGGVFSLRQGGGFYELQYTAQFKAARSIRVEAILSSVVHGTQWIAGQCVRPYAVRFEHARQGGVEGYQAVFGTAQRHFNDANNAVVYTLADWKKVHRPANPVLQDQMQSLLDTQLAQLEPQDWLEGVRGLLQQQPWLSRAQLADRLKLSERHLNRLLAEYELSFKMLSEQIMKQRCLDLLRNSNVTQARLAEYFGYVDQSAFAKAFRRWFGKGFTQFKDGLKEGP